MVSPGETTQGRKVWASPAAPVAQPRAKIRNTGGDKPRPYGAFLSSHAIRPVATAAPTNCAAMNAGRRRARCR